MGHAMVMPSHAVREAMSLSPTGAWHNTNFSSSCRAWKASEILWNTACLGFFGTSQNMKEIKCKWDVSGNWMAWYKMGVAIPNGWTLLLGWQANIFQEASYSLRPRNSVSGSMCYQYPPGQCDRHCKWTNHPICSDLPWFAQKKGVVVHVFVSVDSCYVRW